MLRRTLTSFSFAVGNATRINRNASAPPAEESSSGKKTYKSRVATNIGAEYVDRFYNALHSARLGQFTSGNVKEMKDSSIGNNKGQPVLSDLQPHGIYTLRGETSPSIIVGVPADSVHVQNVKACSKASLMVGHTDPQLFHWFKQLGVVPPRAIISGQADILEGDLKADLWESGFTKHPHIHEIARIRWENDDTKTDKERVHINKRMLEEEEKTMINMQSSDWRRKFKDRERNPNAAEDEEAPVFVMKPETFVLVKITPETQLWANYAGEMRRVYDQEIHDMQKVARSSSRFLKTMNGNRHKLVASLNLSYNMKLANAFVHSVDDKGFYAMAHEEYDPEQGGPREKWMEYRFGFGMDDKPIKDVAEMEWWIRGFMHTGQQENNQQTNEMQEASSSTETRMRYS